MTAIVDTLNKFGAISKSSHLTLRDAVMITKDVTLTEPRGQLICSQSIKAYSQTLLFHLMKRVTFRPLSIARGFMRSRNG